MPSGLPSDIETDLRQDYARGIDTLRRGGTMAIGTLGLCKNTREGRFFVYCYSSKYYIQNVTREEALERIATAKEEVAILLRLFPDLGAEMQGLELAFYFCFDTGKAATLIATEKQRCFEYLPSKT